MGILEQTAMRLLAAMPTEMAGWHFLGRALRLHDQINLSYGLKIGLLAAVELLEQLEG